MSDGVLLDWFRRLWKHRGIAIVKKVLSKLPGDRIESYLDLFVYALSCYVYHDTHTEHSTWKNIDRAVPF